MALSDAQLEQLKQRFQTLQKVNDEQTITIAELTQEIEGLKAQIQQKVQANPLANQRQITTACSSMWKS